MSDLHLFVRSGMHCGRARCAGDADDAGDTVCVVVVVGRGWDQETVKPVRLGCMVNKVQIKNTYSYSYDSIYEITSCTAETNWENREWEV